MKKRKISKKLKAWMDEYTEVFHDIEPIMGIEELENGTSTVAEFKAYNLRWIMEHTQEQVRMLERK